LIPNGPLNQQLANQSHVSKSEGGINRLWHKAAQADALGMSAVGESGRRIPGPIRW